MTLLRQLLRFAVIGVAGTLTYLALFAVLRHVTGAQSASLAARVLTALPTSWLNARVTFAGRVHVLRAYVAGLGGLAAGAALAAVALASLPLLEPAHDRVTEVLVLGAVQLASAAARFVLLRRVSAPAVTADVQRARSLGRAGVRSVVVHEEDVSASSTSPRSTHERPRRSPAAHPDRRHARI